MPDEKSLIQDLREIEEEFRNNGEYRKANVIDLFILQSTHCKISREKVLKKIDYYDDKIKYAESIDNKEQECFYYDIKNQFLELLEEGE